MAGTLISYQGYRAQSVTARRSRGWTADTSVVVFPVTSFPSGFNFATPKPGQILEDVDAVIPSMAALKQKKRRGVPTGGNSSSGGGGMSLRWSGALVIGETDGAQEWQVVLNPMYVLRIERIRGEDGTAALIQVTLADERYMWPRGFLRTWSYNRNTSTGEPAANSLKKDGTPWTLREITDKVVGSFPRSPELARYPSAWDGEQGQREFPPFSPAFSALVSVCQDHGIDAPCLRLDGSVGLHKPGDGRVGYAASDSASNDEDLPDAYKLSADLTGQRFAIEPNYPEDYLVVAGGARIASVTMDNWDPVLFINGDFFKLDADLISKLTEGKFSLEWLHKFVLAPPAYQEAVDLPAGVAKLLREQAYRLFRLPGAVNKDADKGSKQAEIQADEQADTLSPGENAHLLPLLPRAETVGGKRVPVTVERYGFTIQHRTVYQQAGQLQRDLNVLKKQLRNIKAKIIAEVGNPDSATRGGMGFQASGSMPPLTDPVFDLGDLQMKGGEEFLDAFKDMLGNARYHQHLALTDPGMAAQYADTFKKMLQTADQANGTTTATLYDLAKEYVALEKAIKEEETIGTVAENLTEDQFSGALEQLKNKLKQGLDAFAEAKLQRDRIKRIGGDPTALQKATLNHCVVNETRQPEGEGKGAKLVLVQAVDPGARVFSAEAGVIQTSQLAGHVLEEGVPTPAATSFVPRPVRVTFGAVVRPKIVETDAPPPRVLTGAKKDDGLKLAKPKPNVIPEALGDAETYYTSAYVREGNGQKRIKLEEIPEGEGVVVSRPDLVELQPLVGNSNRRALDVTADQIARGRFGVPEKLETYTHLMARPWRVQCNGTVAAVEWRSRNSPAPGTGIETLIVAGSDASLNPLKSAIRPRRQPNANPDNVKREGLA